MRARFRNEPKKEHVTLAHGPNCQCVAHRLQRVVQRGQAAQVAAETAIKTATVTKPTRARKVKGQKKRATRGAQPKTLPEPLANPTKS